MRRPALFVASSCESSLRKEARLRLVTTEFLLAVRLTEISCLTSSEVSLKYEPGPGKLSDVVLLCRARGPRPYMPPLARIFVVDTGGNVYVAGPVLRLSVSMFLQGPEEEYFACNYISSQGQRPGVREPRKTAQSTSLLTTALLIMPPLTRL